MSLANDLQLDEFAEYMLTRSLCKEQHAKFYVFWVKSFFRESKNWKPDAWDVLLQQFVNLLRDDANVEDWQVSQAERAVRLYFNNFRNADELPGKQSRRVAAYPSVQHFKRLLALGQPIVPKLAALFVGP